jgi:uncharacterized protein
MMIIVRLSLLLLLVGPLACATTAQAPSTDQPMMAWKVSGNGLPATSYLVGSFHLTRDTSWLVPELDAALAASDHVAFELDIKAREEEVTDITLRQGTYAGNDNLQAHLPAPLANAVLAKADEAGLPAFIAQKMKPWLLAVAVPVVMMQKQGFDPEKGVDQVLIARARKGNKHIVELERVEDQLGVLMNTPEDVVMLQLERMVEPGGNDEQELAKLSDAWRRGDAVALAKLLDDERKREPRLESFMMAMFDNRNDGMLANALPLMKTAPTMVVVGAGHMLGERGLVKQLQAQGYVVEQMVAKGAR